MDFTDVITYCNDTNALTQELLDNHPEYINEDGPTFLVDKTPTKRNGDETLALVRATDEVLAMLNSLENLTVLGTYEEVFDDVAKKAIYDMVYQHEPYEVELDGEVYTVTPPEKFGVFA